MLESLETIKRPVDRASAVPIETAYMTASIMTIKHVEMYFDFMASSYARNGCSANVVLIDAWRDIKQTDTEITTGITHSGLTKMSERINRSSCSKLKHPRGAH